MLKSLALMLLSCAALSSCQTQKSTANACDGWQKLTPTLETAVKIVVDDRPFANQVAAHNALGIRQKCSK
ncbi:hypothetical protein C8J32_10461 [Rhizobium sp. PP-CC-3A-592]|nr:hypothetical protein C8J32_10461 [Rhizobium sp. PP-CC-3A-592]